MATLQTVLRESSPKRFRAFVGFDGYVDFLYRVIRERSQKGKVPYADITQFGQDVLGRAGISGGFELEKLSVRAGGNGPLMAAALAALGVEVDCVGSLGLPAIDPAFAALSSSCHLHSVASTATTVALEFGDGKLMLGDTEALETLDWKKVVSAIGLDKIRAMAQGADLLALVNWANLAKGTELWQGFLDEVLAKAPRSASGPRIFFDLADLARCGQAETLGLLKLLGRFKAHGEVFLGMNENEAWQLAEKLGLERSAYPSLDALGTAILKHVDVDCLVIHPRSCAVVFQGGKVSTVPGRVVSQVLLSTGGGDNFNAGFCVGLLHGLSGHDAASLAVLVSSSYVENGRSPSKADLLKLLA